MQATIPAPLTALEKHRLAAYVRESCPPLSVAELKRYAEAYLGRSIGDEEWEDFCFRRLGMAC